MDRLTRLPQPILHNILSLLSQKDAIQTSVLSKSWRYPRMRGLGPTWRRVRFVWVGPRQRLRCLCFLANMLFIDIVL
ncbi:hypothetical protein CASFOL_021927 [Castilleja foliolosa]|uniref:F-box domain-containing protein n=1 Tax=Castilleja foliolosa TaxID=1961234 RepID=A0ABD3CXZ6_9LAMI